MLCIFCQHIVKRRGSARVRTSERGYVQMAKYLNRQVRGCAPGLGCYPLIDGASLLLVCERAGTADFGTPCSTGRDCYSGLCDGTRAVCTRLCADGLCPTGFLCQPVPGFNL